MLKSVSARRENSSNIWDLDKTVRIYIHNGRSPLPGFIAGKVRLNEMNMTVEMVARFGPIQQPVDGLQAAVSARIVIVDAERGRVRHQHIQRPAVAQPVPPQ